MTDRLSCIVPGCRRTAKRAGPHADAAEWICVKHWALVPAIRRRAYSRLRRAERKFDAKLPTAARLWASIKRSLGI